jgi:hypothetical protein
MPASTSSCSRWRCRRGDRSRVMTVEELFREMDALDDAEEPGA